MSVGTDNLRAWAEVNLARLERNLAHIRAALPPHLRYVAVVKADAYGHGLAAVAARLMRAGADVFALANLDEAAALREVGLGWPVLILSAILPGERARVPALDVMPTLSSVEEAKAFADLAAKRGRKIRVHLKVDTGMGRLGIWHTDFEKLRSSVATAPGLELAGVFTHFSSAGSDEAVTETQRRRFLEAVQAVNHPGLLIHADNSAGIGSFPEGGPFNGVRIGLLQFGVRPASGTFLDRVHVEPVLSLHARIGLLKELPTGTRVSYDGTFQLRRPSRVAILCAGYADGLPTRLSNRGEVLIAGRRCPIIGRVTMDQTLVDVTDLPQVPRPGERATFIGEEGGAVITVNDFARAADQVAWEVFCTVSKRVRRVYTRDSAT
jgi:alanine racemase